MKFLIFVFMFALFLSGCAPETTDYSLSTAPTSSSVEETESEPVETKPYQLYQTYPVQQPADHIIDNYYYYAESPVVSYHDMEIQRRVVLCSQPNCTHNTEECTAYLGGGNRTRYQVVGDVAYAMINESPEGGVVQFVALNLVSGAREVLWDLTPEEDDTIIEYLSFSIDKTTAFISFCQYDLIVDEDMYQEKNKANYGYALDLTTGERELLLKSEIPYLPGIAITGDSLIPKMCTEEFLLLYDLGDYAQMPVSEEEYYKENPTGDYISYVVEFFPEGAFYSVNRKTGERSLVCSNEAEAKLQDSLGPYRDRKMSFADGDTICIYDGRTGQVTQCFTREGIGYQMCKDGRIIYNVSREDGGWDYFWYDLTTGETQQFQIGTDLMIFSLQEETADFFVGYYNGATRFISKQDWYNENYGAAF